MKLFVFLWLNAMLLVSAHPDFPIVFEENQGQINSKARFISHAQDFRLELQPAGWSIIARSHNRLQTMSARLLGAETGAVMEGVKPLNARTSYLIGNNPAAWITGIHNFEQVRYHGIYPGIDLVFHGTDRQLEYDFLLSPGADRTLFAFLLTVPRGFSWDATASSG